MFKWKIARKMLKSVKQICNENVFILSKVKSE